MGLQAITAQIEAVLSPKRFRHTLGVVKAAEALAKHYGVDTHQAQLAALLHDCCKEYPNKDLVAMLAAAGGPYADPVFLSYPPLLHGPAGALVAQDLYDVQDPEVLEAVRVHTTGKPNMSPLDKIIFLADYIEEGRDFPGVEKIRKWAFRDLDRAVLVGYDETISHLIEEHRPIYEGTIAGRNQIVTALRAQGQFDEKGS